MLEGLTGSIQKQRDYSRCFLDTSYLFLVPGEGLADK